MPDANTLRLHGLMLCMPDTESLSLLQTLAQEHGWMRAGVDELAQIPLTHWQGEYTRLFVSGLPKTAAPPYESVYRHQIMFGPLVDQLTALYEEAGLTLGDMPADYLGTQLEFAAHLSESTDPRAASWQARLWHEHLQHWLPRFIEDLCQHSRLLIYRLWGGQLNLLRTRLQARLAYG